MISFVIATFDRPKDLRVLLSSLLAQTSDAWEALVMDEGVNGYVLRGMGDERIRRISVERQVVTADGRGSLGLLPKHAGVEYAAGDHLCFPSEDVYYLPRFVELMDGHAEDVIGCDMFINYARGFNCLRFQPKVTFADCANYIIRPEWYRRHPFTSFIPEYTGLADGLCVQRCAEDGASVRRVEKFLVMHGGERP